MFGQFHHNVGGGGDGVGAEEQFQSRTFGSSQQTPGGGHVTGDVAVTAFGHLGRSGFDDVGVDEFHFVGVFVTFGENGFVQFHHVGFLGKFAFEVGESLVERFVSHVEYDAEGEHVTAFVVGFLVGALFLAYAFGEGGYGGFHDGVFALELVGEGVGFVTGFLHRLFGESVDVNNHHSAFLGPFQVGFERGGVHCHKDVAFVAGAVDVVTHVHLESRNTGDGVVRGADFCRIVRESSDIVTCKCRCVGEQRAGELHAVARIACKADYEVVFFNYLVFSHIFMFFCFLFL